jgi:hypothetical protein
MDSRRSSMLYFDAGDFFGSNRTKALQAFSDQGDPALSKETPENRLVKPQSISNCYRYIHFQYHFSHVVTQAGKVQSLSDRDSGSDILVS